MLPLLFPQNIKKGVAGVLYVTVHYVQTLLLSFLQIPENQDKEDSELLESTTSLTSGGSQITIYI